MATVPYQPVSSAEPIPASNVQFRLDTPGAAFGENVGAAIKQLGGTVENVGNELAGRAIALQDLNNESAARKAQTDYTVQAGLLQANFDALEGKAKADALPQHLKALQDLRQQFRSGLTTTNAQRMYDSDTMPFMSRTIFTSAARAGDANKDYHLGILDNQMAVANGVYADPNSDTEFEEKKQQVLSAADAKTAIKQDGRGDMRRLDALRELWSSRLDKLVAGGNPERAQQLFDANKEQIYDPQGVLQKRIDSAVNTKTSRTIADSVTADLRNTDPVTQRPPKALQEYLNDGDKIVADRFPNNPALADYVRRGIEINYRSAVSSRQSFEQQNEYTLRSATSGISMPNGKVPTTLEEVLSNPAAAEAYKNANDDGKAKVLKTLAQNAKGDNAWSAPKLRQYQMLKGQAIDDPNGFLSKDVTGLDIPWEARKELINMQTAIIKHQDQLPEAGKMYKFLESGLPTDMRNDPNARQLFQGMLADAMRDYHIQNSKWPSPDEVKNNIAPTLLRSVRDTSGWMGGWDWWNKQTPLYQLQAPADLKSKVKEKSPGMSDEQIDRDYRSQRYQELHSKQILGPTEKIMPQ